MTPAGSRGKQAAGHHHNCLHCRSRERIPCNSRIGRKPLHSHGRRSDQMGLCKMSGPHASRKHYRRRRPGGYPQPRPGSSRKAINMRSTGTVLLPNSNTLPCFFSVSLLTNHARSATIPQSAVVDGVSEVLRKKAVDFVAKIIILMTRTTR
jgi:hypothetical protein